jgi:hypothetical protein
VQIFLYFLSFLAKFLVKLRIPRYIVLFRIDQRWNFLVRRSIYYLKVKFHFGIFLQKNKPNQNKFLIVYISPFFPYRFYHPSDLISQQTLHATTRQRNWIWTIPRPITPIIPDLISSRRYTLTQLDLDNSPADHTYYPRFDFQQTLYANAIGFGQFPGRSHLVS